MSFLSGGATEQALVVRPKLNVGLGLDIIHGEMARGMKGDIIINGGMPNLSGGTAIGNGGKTALALAEWAIIMHRYNNASSRINDTELTLGLSRIQSVWMHHAPHGRTMDIFDWDDFYTNPDKFIFSDRASISSSEHHDSIRKAVKARLADKKALVDTPFRDRDGKPMKYFNPHIEINDSFSAYAPDAVEAVRDQKAAGDSGRNMEALTNARVKTQMLTELAVDTAKGGVYYYTTAHMGEQHDLDPYKPAKEKLAFIKRGLKMKDVPEKMTFYPGIFWWAYASRPLVDDKKKPLFPSNNDYQNDKGSVDLMEIHICAIRNKSGPTGEFKKLVMSQTRGLIDSLTNFCNCLDHNRFGIMGKDGNPNNLINYYMELRPDVPLSRHTVEEKAEKDYRLHRAITLTSELLDVLKYWSHIPDHWRCTAAELYEGVKAKGYDWDELLDTRMYWTYDHYDREDHYISIIDLMRMRVGEYHPWWMKEKPSAKTTTGEAA